MAESGVQRPLPFPTESECFKLFLTEELVGEIVEETNRYALELLEKREPGVRGKLAKWVTTTISEMYTFLVTVLLMGIVKKNSLREYWSTDPMFATPFFASLFSQDRFLVLLRCLHFVNNATAILSDPLYKIRNVLISLTSAFGRVFVPYKDLCIDESLMLWKGRLAFRQYIPSKRHRFGVKFFVMCDVKTAFVQDIIVYTGSTTDIKHYEGLGVSGSVVMTMLAPHLGKRHTLYVDNWYSSPTLFQHLLSNSTGACGTVRSVRKGMPAFGCGKMQRGEVEFQENGQQLAVKWHDKRDVHALSTVHTATGKVDHLTGERKIKPDCVLDYNLKMGAVDKADMINVHVWNVKYLPKIQREPHERAAGGAPHPSAPIHWGSSCYFLKLCQLPHFPEKEQVVSAPSAQMFVHHCRSTWRRAREAILKTNSRPIPPPGLSWPARVYGETPPEGELQEKRIHSIQSLTRIDWKQPRWEGPYQVPLVTAFAVRIAERAIWVHVTHCKRVMICSLGEGGASQVCWLS
uniref:piggyBac transposable element-derived protein 4-like n=1 Tax=Oncorhynchus gorbuscha TaxID=8017 RepID=UPI001EAEC357|nr:piggyBac transposable element-derived protein 4-like [Oncorhynchus gorbuscha]